MMKENKKVKVKLVGEEGNAFSILSRVVEAMKKANWSKEEISQYQKEAIVGDYYNLLRVTMKYVDDINVNHEEGDEK